MRIAASCGGKPTIDAISHAAAPLIASDPAGPRGPTPHPDPVPPNYTLFPPPRPRAFRVSFGALPGNAQPRGIPPFLARYHGSIDGAFGCTNRRLGETAYTKSMFDIQTRQTARSCHRGSPQEHCHRGRSMSVRHTPSTMPEHRIV